MEAQYVVAYIAWWVSESVKCWFNVKMITRISRKMLQNRACQPGDEVTRKLATTKLG